MRTPIPPAPARHIEPSPRLRPIAYSTGRVAPVAPVAELAPTRILPVVVAPRRRPAAGPVLLGLAAALLSLAGVLLLVARRG